MMSDYDNTNTGVLFKNADKKTPNHPDHKGSINIEGVEYWMSAWVKTAGPTSKNPGSKFFSMAFTKKDRQTQTRRAGRADQYDEGPKDEGFDDIPF